MLPQLGQHGSHVQAQRGQTALRDFDEQLFVLHAEQFDLVDIFDLQQLLAGIVSQALEFGIAVPIALQGVDDPVHIAEIVVEEGPHHPLGQGGPHVVDFFAHRVPGLGHISGLGAVFHLEDDLRFTRLGIAADFVGMGHLLQGFFQLVGHLLGHLLGCGPWPVSPHHHCTEGKRGVFILPQLKVGGNAQQHQHHHQVAGQRGMLQRPARQVETRFGVLRGHRTHG